MALVSNGLRAARLVSDGLEGMSEAWTRHLACGMAMEMSCGIGGHRHILMMAMWPWKPCLTCVDLPLHMPEAHSSHSDASQIVMRHGHVYYMGQGMRHLGARHVVAWAVCGERAQHMIGCASHGWQQRVAAGMP